MVWEVFGAPCEMTPIGFSMAGKGDPVELVWTLTAKKRHITSEAILFILPGRLLSA